MQTPSADTRLRYLGWLLAAVLLTTGIPSARGIIDPPDEHQDKPRYTNRLIDETSPYLLLHAHNPVDWYPWGSEAFEEARSENKPIFLSIGYSSCHWCHVMEREVFSDPQIAAYMNEHFLNIKVDREERPDIDEVYMTALQIYYRLAGSNQSGGWPMSMFLTPDGKPFLGGTYFPPEDRHGLPGFPKILRRVHELWREQRPQVEKAAEELAVYVRRSLQGAPPLRKVELTSELVTNVVDDLRKNYDPVHGGFSGRTPHAHQPKFPEPPNLMLLLHQYDERGDEEAIKMARRTLDAMAAGGIRDHLGGGFHRYSTDPYWRIPHFEKMLYDNAQLAEVYVEAYRLTDDPQYRRVAEGTFRFIQREMTDPQGGFYSALNAETEGEEGKYYVWTADEIRGVWHAHASVGVAPDNARLFNRVYGLSDGPNFEGRANVLLIAHTIAEVAAEFGLSEAECRNRLETMRERLLQEREERPRPLLDTKVLTAWNGLMISALARGGIVLEDPAYTAAAEKAADFLLQNLRTDEGRLLRTYRDGQAKIPGYLDDYAFLIDGLLDLHEATGNDRWLNEARRLTDICLEDFSDENRAAFYFTSNRHEELLARTKDPYDAVLPSGNSMMASNLVRLAQLTGNEIDPPAERGAEEYRDRAGRLLESFAPQIEDSPDAFPHMAAALSHWLKVK